MSAMNEQIAKEMVTGVMIQVIWYSLWNLEKTHNWGINIAFLKRIFLTSHRLEFMFFQSKDPNVMPMNAGAWVMEVTPAVQTKMRNVILMSVMTETNARIVLDIGVMIQVMSFNKNQIYIP